MKTRIIAAVLALTVGGLALAPLASPAVADTLQQAYRRLGNTFIVTSVTGAALDVDQRGAGSILNLSDGGADEYTFDLTSATFVNQLNLSDDLKIGNGTPGVTLDGEDAYIEGTLEVDGAATFDGAVTLPSGDVSASEIANVVRYVPIPLMSFIECDTDAGALIGFDTTADALPDFVNSATDGTGFVLRFDDTGSSEDQSTSVCAQVLVPADYASGGAFEIRALKDAHTAATEVLNCAVSVNGAALQAAGTTTTSASASTAYACTPTIASLAANDSLSFHLYITSDSTMNDIVDIAAVAFFYTATQ